MKIAIKAMERLVKGTGASRRLRHAGKVPGILYGNHKDAKMCNRLGGRTTGV